MLRELMTKSIMHDGWLDYAYPNRDNTPYDCNDYKKWLDSLDDSDFLFSYNWVKIQESNLD
jgi:hypothetical protein